jgi:hypothetical protein
MFLLQYKNTGVSLNKLIARYWLLIALSPIFYIFKSTIWKPSGAYEGYNELRMGGLLYGGFVLGIALAMLLFGYWRYRIGPSSSSLSLLILVLGIFTWALGMFPYLAIGLGRLPVEWLTRDTLLWPLGMSLIVMALIRLASSLVGRRIAIISGALILVLSIVMSMSITFSFMLDWQKQNRIMELLAADVNVRTSSLIIFKDDLETMNIFASPYRFYAWNGMMSRAFGDSTRLGINEHEIPQFLSGQLDTFFGPGSLNYGAREYVATDIVTEVEITKIGDSDTTSDSLSDFFRKLRILTGLPPLPSQIVNTDEMRIRSTLISKSDLGEK